MSGNLQSEEEQLRAVTDLIKVCEDYEYNINSSLDIMQEAFEALSIIPIPIKKYDDLIGVIFKKLMPIEVGPSLLIYPDLFKRVISMLPPDKKDTLTKDLID